MGREIKKILVVRFRRVGDAVLTAALCSSLKKTFPEAELHYVLNEAIAPLFDNHPDVDKVIHFSQRDNANLFRYVARVWQVMREHDYEVIVDVRSTFRTLFFALFGLAAPYRIGTRKSYNRILHNHRIDNRRDKSTDVIRHLLMLLKPLEAERPLVHCHDFTLYVSEAERLAFRQVMEREGVDFGRPVILAAVAARLAHKVWDKAKMRQILQRIIDKYNAQIIFNFAGDEEAYALSLHREMGNSAAIFTSIKAPRLRELCALAVNCDAFFGNEGGPRHLAQALGVPAFAIFPPGIPKAMWLPAQSDSNQGISPDDVLAPDAQRTMDYAARFDLIDVDVLWTQLDAMLAKTLSSRDHSSK